MNSDGPVDLSKISFLFIYTYEPSLISMTLDPFTKGLLKDKEARANSDGPVDLSESSGALIFCELRWASHFLKNKIKLCSKRGRCCYRFAANSQISLMASSRFQIQPDEAVLLRVTHSNIKSFSAEIRFSLQVQNPQTLLAESQVSFTETWINLYYF